MIVLQTKNGYTGKWESHGEWRTITKEAREIKKELLWDHPAANIRFIAKSELKKVGA